MEYYEWWGMKFQSWAWIKIIMSNVPFHVSYSETFHLACMYFRLWYLYRNIASHNQRYKHEYIANFPKSGAYKTSVYMQTANWDTINIHTSPCLLSFSCPSTVLPSTAVHQYSCTAVQQYSHGTAVRLYMYMSLCRSLYSTVLWGTATAVKPL